MVIYTHPNLLYISWDIAYTQKNTNSSKSRNSLEYQPRKKEDNQFKMISDYKPSGKFLEKLNL